MGVIYVVSAEPGAGKTAVCAGIAVNLMGAGRKVGFLKPQVVEETLADGDIAFMKKALGLEDLVNAPDIIKGRDTVLVEALLGKRPEDTASKDAYGAAKEMRGRVIGVEEYTADAYKHMDLYRGFGESLLGVIINKVPQSRIKAAKEAAAAQFGEAGIKVLGVIPENRSLQSLTVGEIAAGVRGKIINNPEKSGDLVENYMLGALTPDSGVDYFKRKSRKAAVIRQERADMQLAALDTPTACLILGGSSQLPVYTVLGKAVGKGVPVITTDAALPDIIVDIERTMQSTRLHQEKKLAKLAEIVKQNLDMKLFG